MNNLRQAIRQVVEPHSRNYRGRAEDYELMNSSQVLLELHERREELGLSPDYLRSINGIDVENELQSLYGMQRYP